MTKPRVEFNWSVNLGQLLTIVSIVVAGVIFAVRLEGRINLNENEISNVKASLAEAKQSTKDDISDIKRAIEAIRNYLTPPRDYGPR